MSTFSKKFGVSKRSVARNLRSAAATIDTYGWIRHALGNKKDGFCAIGALSISKDSSAAYITAKQLVTAVVGPIAAWNDYSVYDKSEVTGLFRKLAGQLDHGGGVL